MKTLLSISQIIKLIVSVLFLLGLFVFFDKQEFWSLEIQFNYLWQFIFTFIAIIFTFSYRWKTLLPSATTTKIALHSTIIGLGGNQVLPARGGDILRALHIKKFSSSTSLHRILSAIVIEKIIDLIVITVLGFTCVSILLSGGDKSGLKITYILMLLTIFTCLIVIILMVKSGVFAVLIKKVSRLFKVRPTVYRHLYIAIQELQNATQTKKIIYPVLLSVLLWFVLYIVSYYVVGKMIGIQLNWYELSFLVFMGGIGLAIPAAPSGLGIYHASIVSGFILLGRDASEGLIFGIAIHGIFFISLVFPALFAYLLDHYLSKKQI